MSDQPFHAVRIVVTHDDGSTSTRDYVRGDIRMGVDRFNRWALGDMIALVSDGTDPITWKWESIDFPTVIENRQYAHTTHDESGALR